MVFTALVLAASLLGQATAHPDFTATWKMVPDRSGSPGQVPPVTEMTITVHQTPTEIQMETVQGSDKPIVATYPIGPTPKQPDEPLGADQKRAFWDGDRLVLERGGTISGQTVSMKESLTFDPAHSEMIVERLVIVQHGYTLKGTRNYATVKDVFTRAQ